MAHNEFCHIELTTDDVSKAKEFYGSLLSWKFEDMDMGEGGNYTMIRPGAGPEGGMMLKPMPEIPSAWTPYVLVEDLNTTTEKAKQLGGEILVPPTPIPNVGSFSVIKDPTGGVIGLFQGAAEK